LNLKLYLTKAKKSRFIVNLIVNLTIKIVLEKFSMDGNTDLNIGGSGAFVDSLKRNNAKIREDRAISIAEDAQIIYKREVEDLEIQIKRLRRERDSMLDLSPTTADSLVLATDFNSKEFVAKDIAIGVQIRNLEIKLEIARDRYNYLFG
jgi:hypothetical protein